MSIPEMDMNPEIARKLLEVGEEFRAKSFVERDSRVWGECGRAQAGFVGGLLGSQAVHATNWSRAGETDARRLVNAERGRSFGAVFNGQCQHGQCAAGRIAGEEYGVWIDWIIGQMRLDPT